MAVDDHIEARGGATILRLVHSGFGKGADWDGEYYDAVFEATQKYNFVMSFIDDDSDMVQVIFVDTNHGNTDPFKMVEVVNTRKAE
jgi:hypothetical protein